MQFLRRPLRILVIVLTLVVGAAATGLATTQTTWFKNWLRGYIEREANLYLNGELSIERLGGNLFSGVKMENIRVEMDGQKVVAVESLSLRYSLFELISKGMSVSEIRLNQPVLFLRREGDGWSIARLIKREEQEADRQGPAYPIAISKVGLTGASIIVDGPIASGLNVPQRYDKIDAEFSFDYAPVHYSINITNVSFRASNPRFALNALSGGLSVKDDTLFIDKIALRTEETALAIDGAVQHYLTKPQLNLQISSDKVSLSELAGIIPAVDGVDLQPAFELHLNGPMDHLAVDMNVRSSAGAMTGTMTTDLMAPGYSAVGDLSVRNLDLQPIVKGALQRTDITANAKLDVQTESVSDPNAFRGVVSLDAPRIEAAGYAAQNIVAKAQLDGRRIAVNGRASAYGTKATVAGRVTLQGQTTPLSYDLKGRAEHLDLRRLPADLHVPKAETNISADYHVRGTEPPKGTAPRTVDGELRFNESTVAGTRIESGSTAGVTLRGSAVSYQADATLSDLDLQRVGQAFDVPALASDRYSSDLNGHVTLSGTGTTPQEMNLRASGTLADSTILGGQLPQLAFDTTIDHDTASVTAAGSFAGFDPARLSGKPAMEGAVTGTLDVQARISGVSQGVTVDNVTGTALVALEPSTVGRLEIAEANIDADYHDLTGDIRTLVITGRDLNVQASGTLALNDTGQSNLTVHADTPSLETLGRLFETPITGIARVDGTVTGNRTELKAAGTLVGNGVRYQENGALTVSSDYNVRVPNLTFERAIIEADTHATFATVAGQNINELTAKTKYVEKKVVFDATAKQPEQTLGIAGALELHPEHQEVHLERLALDTRGLQWQLAPGSSASIQYGGDRVSVSDLKLVSGAQHFAAEGTLGHSGDVLHVTMTNVDLANVDALMLRPPQLTGRANASGSLTGSMNAPAVKAAFQVAQGGFREFRYDAFTGTVEYAGEGITVDSRLQQNATQWITAKGHVPMALFRSPAKESGGNAEAPVARHVPPATSADRIDLVIDSSPIDLGVVQGFTTLLTNVTGTLEAHVRVTGSADDPHPEGAITVQNGAATVEPAGVHYTDIAGRIDLQPDRVHIDKITVLDNHKSELSISGDLALHEREIGAVALRLRADDFKVIDNKMGNVRVASELEVSGELRAPRLEGSLDVTTGQINLDEVIALAGTSAYPTKPTEFVSGTTAEPGEVQPPNVFDALSMNVTLIVPNDLIVKASDLQAGGAPIGMGALNVTLGGDLRATKSPGGPVILAGSVNTVRGTYDFQGRRFEILRDGAVYFDGIEQLNPRLDLRTRRVIQGVEARVNVRGTLREPEIELSSTPPLEQADILSLIVFNQPINQLGEGQQISLVARAQGLAAGAITSQIVRSIGGALNLDTFELNLAPETGGGPQLTVGQQVGRNLYVKVQQGLGDDSATNVVLEYELTDWLRLQTNVLQNSSTQQSVFRRAPSTGADLIFFFSY